MPQTIYTEEEYNDLRKDSDIMYSLANKFAGLVKREAGVNDQPYTEEQYGYIPTHPHNFAQALRVVKQDMRKNNPKNYSNYGGTFLECGCGIGTILMVASSAEFGFEAHGIENNPKLVEVAKRLIGTDRIREGDISIFPNYGKYDVIFYYCPYCTESKEKAFELFLEKNVKPGAYIIAHHKREREAYLKSGFREVAFLDIQNGFRIIQKKVRVTPVNKR